MEINLCLFLYGYFLKKRGLENATKNSVMENAVRLCKQYPFQFVIIFIFQGSSFFSMFVFFYLFTNIGKKNCSFVFLLIFSFFYFVIFLKKS